MLVGISELDSETILLYPNPMSDMAYLEFEDSAAKTISLLNVQGEEVRIWKECTLQNIVIQRNDLSAGSYIVSIEQNGRTKNLKLIIK